MSELRKILVQNFIKPVILRKSVSHSNVVSKDFVLPLKATNKTFREDIIYRGDELCMLNDNYPNLTIVNSLNVLHNSTRTVASYTIENKSVHLDSDEVTKVIGNENYDVVFKALSSVSDRKLQVQAILALLTANKNTANKLCQTNETHMDNFKRDKSRRKRPMRCKAYVIDDKQVIKTQKKEDRKAAQSSIQNPITRQDSIDNLLDLKLIVDEDSNISDASVGNISILSSQIPHNVLVNPKSLLNNIDKYTKETLSMQSCSNNIGKIKKESCSTMVTLVDGSTVMLQAKPEDVFHIATTDTLRDLSVEDKKRVMLHQAYIDWKYCLQSDDEGNLPIHVAVLKNDTELLKRHCALLKSRNACIDVIGGASMTPLQLAIFNNSSVCTSMLLQYGADVLLRDEQARSVLHLAAENSVGCVHVILEHCRKYARKIIQEEEELWKPELEEKSDEELVLYLLQKLCAMCNDAGYTALMIASMKGDHAIVSALLEASPESVNIQMPTCGNTALYIAFRTAFTEAELSGNRNKIAPNYLDIIETLHKYGADPLITNDSGNSVATLTADFKISDLSQSIANRLLVATNVKKSFEDYILVKDKQGDINVELLTLKKKTVPILKKEQDEKKINEDPAENPKDAKQKGKKGSARKVIIFSVGSKEENKFAKIQKITKNAENNNLQNMVRVKNSEPKLAIRKHKPIILTKPRVTKPINLKDLPKNALDNIKIIPNLKPTDNKSINKTNVNNFTDNVNVIEHKGPFVFNILDNISLTGVNKVKNTGVVSEIRPVVGSNTNSNINTNVKVKLINKAIEKTIKVGSQVKDGVICASSPPPLIKIANKQFKNKNVLSSNIPIVSKILPINIGGEISTDNVKITDKIQMQETKNTVEQNAQSTLKRSASDTLLKFKRKRN